MKVDESTSTEQLLSLIRSGSAKPAEKVPPLSLRQGLLDKKANRPSSGGRSAHKGVRVGVDVGHERLRLVKAQKSDPWSPVAYRSVPLPPGEDKGSEAFRAFLRAELTSFCGDEDAELWTVMSSARVEVRHIRVPKVPDDKLEQVVYWTLKKEAPFDEKEYFFDYEVTGESVEQGAPRLGLMCYTAPVEDVEKIKRLFSEAGFTLTGISIVPFIVQNILRTGPEKSSAHLFIGNGFSRIDLYEGGRLALTRDIKTGVNSMIELMAEALRERLGEAGPAGQDRAREILFALGRAENGTIVQGDGFFIGREEAQEVISPVLERLVRQVERTIDHFTMQHGRERVGKIHVSSVMPVSDAKAGYFGEQLGMASGVFDPLGLAMPREDLAGRTGFIPAFGLALSDNAYTPNLLFTYKDRKKKAAVRRLNRGAFAVFVASVVLCSGFYAHQLTGAGRKKAELARLEQVLQQRAPAITRETMLELASQKKREHVKWKELVTRYAGPAVLGELSSLTPEAVSLTAVRFGPRERSAKGKGKEEKARDETRGAAHIEGVITGEPGTLETLLAAYVMNLSASPMFSEVKAAQGSEPARGRGDLLAFTLSAAIGPEK